MKVISHPNSKKITIFRLPNFLEGAQTADTGEFFSQGKQSVGSFYSSKDSREIGSGLTNSEKNLLLPLIIDIYPEEREFRKAVSEFYADIDTNVPYKTGRELEVGLEKDNNKPVDKDNMPLNTMDYIRYKQAMAHPHVALTKEAGAGNMLKRYYIFDKETVFTSNESRNKEKDAAMATFLKIKDNPDTVDQMLTLLGINIREYSGKGAKERKVEKLRDLAEKQETIGEARIGGPVEFNKVYNGDQMEVKFWIQRMLNVRVLFTQANKYFDAETKKVLGNSLDEIVAVFLDETNTDMINVLKARVQEIESTPLKENFRRTVVS